MYIYKFVGVYTFAAWMVVTGLALMVVGGLVLWAYGARRQAGPLQAEGPEAEATRAFHAKLSRWFFIYGVGVILAGGLLLLWASSVIF